MVKGIGEVEVKEAEDGAERSWFRSRDMAKMIFVRHVAERTIKIAGEQTNLYPTWEYYGNGVLVSSLQDKDTIQSIRDSKNVPVYSVIEKPYIPSGDFPISFSMFN